MTAAVLLACLFPSAGTFNYWRGWIFFTVFIISSQALEISLLLYDPKLLERRMNLGLRGKGNFAKDHYGSRDGRILCDVGIAGPRPSLRLFSCPGAPLDRRRYTPPALVPVVHCRLQGKHLCGFHHSGGGGAKGCFDWSVRLSQTSALSRGSRYAHGIPLARGSWWRLCVLVFIVPVLIRWLADEEKLLKKDLPGTLPTAANYLVIDLRSGLRTRRHLAFRLG